MAQSGQEIANPRTGQRMLFLKTAGETGGALLSMQTTNPPTGEFEPVHVHPLQESSAKVLSGRLHFVMRGKSRIVGPGEAVTIPAGAPHHFCNDGGEDAVAIQEFRPALRTAEFFETYFELARRGELDDEGRPSLMRFAVLGPAFADEIRLASPPWPLQRLAFALLGPLARARGHRTA
jgi:quercetin dioxygenase-like cupin family protein